MPQKIKILFVLDYIKAHYFKAGANGEPIDLFMQTDEGKKLQELLAEAFKAENADPRAVELKVIYAYNDIPEILRENKRNPSRNSYAKPGQTAINAFKPLFYENVVNYAPDIIIPMGGYGTKFLLNKTAISKLRGLPNSITLNDKEYPILPIFAPTYVLSNPSVIAVTKADMRLLARFVRDGKEAFKPAETDYNIFTNDFTAVLGQLKQTLTHGKTLDDPIAMDVETNTLDPYAPNAKILTVTISTQAKTGYTFPLYHPDMPWKPEEQTALNEVLKYMLTSELYVVGHNFMFDTRIFKQTIFGDVVFKHVIDTIVAYYISTDQEVKTSFTLKHLAIEFTDVGGYEQPLDDYKEWFKESGNKASFLAKLIQEHDGDYTITDQDYLNSLTPKQRQYAYDLGIKLLTEVDWDFAKVINQQDGGTFDYTWIPYTLLGTYATGDGDVTIRLHNILYGERVKGHTKLEELYGEHYPALLDTLTRMEGNGLYLDKERLEYMRDKIYPKRMQELEEAIKSFDSIQQVATYKENLYMEGLEEKAKKPADRDKEQFKLYTKYRKPEDRVFRFGNNQDKALLIFGILGYRLPIDPQFVTQGAMKRIRAKKLDPDNMTWEDWSTGSSSMERLLEEYLEFQELGNLLIEYQRYAKLSTSFTDSLLDSADKESLVHSRFGYVSTNTSRLASSAPKPM